MKNESLKNITSQRLFLPVFCLALVLLVNIVTTPNFFAIEVRDGMLYGYIIDIINRASELVILAVGMTLVVSSSAGTDISVGAIMAVSAAVCCNILTGGERAATVYASPLILGFIAAIIVGILIGCFNGFLVAKLNIQPMVATLIMFTAGRGIAQLITDGQITYVRVDSYRAPAQKDGAGHVHPVRRNQQKVIEPHGHQGHHDHFPDLRLLRLLLRPFGPDRIQPYLLRGCQ